MLVGWFAAAHYAVAMSEPQSTTSPTEHPSIVQFREAHTQLGGTGRIVILPDSVHTAALAAEALGCEVGAIANSLLFDAEGTPVLILTSGSHRVNTEATAARVGVPALKRAAPEFVREHTGQVIGGVSPIAHPAPVPTWLDSQLQQYDVVWAAAGTWNDVFALTPQELVRASGGTVSDLKP